MTKHPATKINDRNYEIAADGETVGFVLRYTLGKSPGWYFVAAHKRFTNRYPDSAAPAQTWQEAVPA